MKSSLKDLRESNAFLNLLLDNINSAVLIADENLQIYQFNSFFLKLFDPSDLRVAEKSFGAITGCINSVNENRPCGKSSRCAACILRQSIVKTMTQKVPVDNVRLERIFYINGVPTEKYLEFSTRHIDFQGRRMTLVIIYDITDIEKQKIVLQQKQNLLDLDLKAAAGIQKSLLPESSPRIPNIHVAWKFEPCERIGGDIFNIHYPDEKHIGFYMLDVCGHGVSAALISVAVSQFLQNIRILADDDGLVPPEHVLNSINRAFPFERFDSYFTIIYMTIDLFDGCLTYSCAGHPPPVLLRNDRTLEILDRHGPVIGLSRNAPFGQARRQLQRGDRVVLYTDGILEISNPVEDHYGKNRFYKILKVHKGETAPALANAIYNSVKKFGKGKKPDDDLSILVIEYTG
ncbi:MAG: PP2C family protein-serine/threonine phosphatase [Thermodesulfobacteriota bacterium]